MPAEVAEWLAALLKDGPVLGSDIRSAGKARGYSRPRLRKAADEMGVVVSVAGPRSTWSLPAPLVELAPEVGEGERQCKTCGEVKPLDEFAAHRKNPSGRSHRCLPCDNRRKRASEQTMRDGEHPLLVASLVDSAPDPAPARALRHELARRRRAGQSFEEAWATAQVTALSGLDQEEAAEWRAALSATRSAWQDGYERTGSGALAELVPVELVAV